MEKAVSEQKILIKGVKSPHKIKFFFLPFFFLFFGTFRLNKSLFIRSIKSRFCPIFLEIQNPWGKYWKEVVSELKKEILIKSVK